MAPMLEATVRADAADAGLIARLKAGDEAAYEEMVRTLGGRLLAVARRVLRDEDAARDAVQEAMLSAVRAIHGFDGHSRLSTWLHRIVVNAALMRIRARQRRPEQSIEPLLPRFPEDGHHAEPVTSWAESADRLIERAETQALVRAALDELPESYRVVIMMRDIDGMSTLDTAAVFGITENALKLRLHRARQALGTVFKRRLAETPAERLSARPCATRPARTSALPSHLLRDPAGHLDDLAGPGDRLAAGGDGTVIRSQSRRRPPRTVSTRIPGRARPAPAC
jgi:RNA polymerase sigma-70 factor (ECF subfamily)